MGSKTDGFGDRLNKKGDGDDSKILLLHEGVYSDSLGRDFSRWGRRWMLTFESRSEASRITSILYSIHVYHKFRFKSFIKKGKWARI